MFECGMSGCFDSSSHTLEYTYKEKNETLEICERCAEWWRWCFLDEDETATTTKHKNNKERELAK